jgi:hypothetical protein
MTRAWSNSFCASRAISSFSFIWSCFCAVCSLSFLSFLFSVFSCSCNFHSCPPQYYFSGIAKQ